MKNIVFIVFLSLTSSHCYSQGGWDIGYVPIDSIDQKIIGHDVKLDFKSKRVTSHKVPEFPKNYISNEDSIMIILSGHEVAIKEKRNIHLDWGFYDEQFLECPNFAKNEIVRIYHSVIEDLNEDSLLVRLYVEVYAKYRNGIISDNLNRRYCLHQWIPKNKLNGVMIKE